MAGSGSHCIAHLHHVSKICWTSNGHRVCALDIHLREKTQWLVRSGFPIIFKEISAEGMSKRSKTPSKQNAFNIKLMIADILVAFWGCNELWLGRGGSIRMQFAPDIKATHSPRPAGHPIPATTCSRCQLH